MGKSSKVALIFLLLILLSFGEEIPIYVIVKGKVEKVFVKEGQKVKMGEPIVKISPILYEAEIRSLMGKLKELELKRWKAKRDYERYRELFERDLLAETILEDKKLALEIVEAKIEEIKGKIAKLEALKKYTLVKSPSDGTVQKLLVREGSFVNGSLTPHLIAVIKTH